jgi:PKD repeat protein
MKALDRIEMAFHYNKRGVKIGNNLTVLKCSKMYSTITEASYITDPVEAEAFCEDEYLTHSDLEAQALCDALVSFRDNKGFALVDYNYGGKYMSDSWEVDIDGWLRYTPYRACWLVGEEHILHAQSGFYDNGYYYFFDRWIHRDDQSGAILESTGANPWTIWVDFDFDGLHWYEALYKGGSFQASITKPMASETEIMRLDTIEIQWNAPEGVLSSCSLSIYYSTDNQKNWTKIIGPVAYNYGGVSMSSEDMDDGKKSLSMALDKGGPSRVEPLPVEETDNSEIGDTVSVAGAKDALGKYNWIVPNVASDSCFLRIIAYDMVGNRDTAISHRFSIRCWIPKANFSASLTTGPAPLVVCFTDLSTYEPTG